MYGLNMIEIYQYKICFLIQFRPKPVWMYVQIIVY